MKRAVIAVISVAAAGAALAAVAVTSASAAIPAGTIHGCVNTSGSDRVLHRVYTNPANGTTCPSGEMMVIWPNGPETAGTDGLGTIIATNSGAGPTDAVTCPADQPYVLGGGFQVTSGGPLIASYPDASVTPNRWVVSVTVGVVAGYAICAR